MLLLIEADIEAVRIHCNAPTDQNAEIQKLRKEHNHFVFGIGRSQLEACRHERHMGDYLEKDD